MSITLKAWCLGAVVTINALLVPALMHSWLYIYDQYSYPLDFLFPVSRTQTRARICLFVAAITVPLGVVLYRKAARDLPPFIRAATLVVTCCTAFVAIAFATWRYLR